MKLLTRFQINNQVMKLFCIFLFMFIQGCSFTHQIHMKSIPGDPTLRNELDAIFNDPEFFDAQWGVMIQSLKTGDYIYLRNENKNFMPASNMKLFTTAIALIKLSPTFRFCTPVYYRGEITPDGVLNGDIIVKGSGDPTISGRYHNGDITRVFKTWVDSLKLRGIQTIRGDIIGDDDYFDEEIMGEGWAWDDQSDWYAAQISALSFNDNCMDISLSPGDSVGALARIDLQPTFKYVEIDNRVVTVGEGYQTGIIFNRNMGTNRVQITGSISIHSKQINDLFSVENPTLYAASVLKETFENAGITVTGSAKDKDNLTEYHYTENDSLRIAKYYSPPLSEIVHTINKVSQNLYSELLLRALGAQFKKRGNSKTGILVIKEYLSTIGINPDRFDMVDGSGLSRLNLITPKQITTLLSHMRRHPLSDSFYNSLPIAGIDGSLKNRMIHSEAKGRVRAKTGYLGNVVSLSGYVQSIDDELVFSIIGNNYTVPTVMAHAIQDLVCLKLINHSNR